MSDTKTARAAATVQPPTYLPLGVHLAGSIPLPSADQFDPSHFAMLLAVLPPATVKSPPT